MNPDERPAMVRHDPTVPRELTGAWRRRSIRLGSEPEREDYDVVWIQGERGFADLRLPKNPAERPIRCFAGRATWDGSHLTWHHELDIDPVRRNAPDVGAIEYSHDVLIERGMITAREGAPAEYVEEYVRMSQAEDTVTVAEHRSDDGTLLGARAQVGDLRLTVVDHAVTAVAAVCEQLIDGRWSALMTLAGDSLPDLDALPWTVPGNED